jgi:hypothetical protein
MDRIRLGIPPRPEIEKKGDGSNASDNREKDPERFHLLTPTFG